MTGHQITGISFSQNDVSIFRFILTMSLYTLMILEIFVVGMKGYSN